MQRCGVNIVTYKATPIRQSTWNDGSVPICFLEETSIGNNPWAESIIFFFSEKYIRKHKHDGCHQIVGNEVAEKKPMAAKILIAECTIILAMY